MRSPADLPRRLPGASRRFRVTAIIVVIAIIVLIAVLNWLARFWTDYLWFESVGFTSVFRGVLLTKVVLALVFIAIFFVLMLANLTVADRVAPEDLPPNADELVLRYRDVVTPYGRLERIVVAGIFALLAGVGANREWNNWDLLRYHVSFGATDAEFHKDVGFYVFELPFIKFLLGWAFEAVIVVFIVTAVAHYLNGGIHLQDVPRRVTAAVKTHLSVLLGVLALIKAVDYYFERLELVLSRSHVVNGATATSVHADKPAKFLLMIIAVIAAALFLYNIREKGWTLPTVGVVLWVLVYVVIGVAYPAVYQAVRVNPSELTRESTYIQRNINATRAAYGLNNISVETPNNSGYQYSPTVATAEVQGNTAEAQASRQTIANIRLLDPAVSLSTTFDRYQALRPYYQFNELSVDRYVLPPSSGSSGSTASSASAGSSATSPSDGSTIAPATSANTSCQAAAATQAADNQSGEETATIASVRELNSNTPSGFLLQHLEYTHGYGAVLAPISEAGINPDGSPDFSLSDLPPSGTPSLCSTGSQVYYGLGENSSYVVADSKTQEIDYESANGQTVETRYAGSGGVDAGSLIRRAAFALRFGDFNFVLSGQITPTSKVMYVRNIVDRVKKAAPFLKYDSDPYAVILNGQVYWVIDAYTTTDNYPYSQNANTSQLPANSGLNTTFNYVRNSVKVVVSAYNGSMHFFAMNDNDPIIKVYERAFPDLFTPVAQANSIIPGIVAHFRYPEDLFQIQADMYGRYHLTNANDFYTQAQAWTVSPDPGSGPIASTSSYFTAPATATSSLTAAPVVQELAPQYILAAEPGSTQQSFMLVSPFVPVGGQAQGQNLTALLTASSDPNDYGELRVYETPVGQTVDGPELASNAIRGNTAISQQLTLLDQHGSTVELGEIAIVPIAQTLVYVEPIYLESSATGGAPLLKDVVVVYDDKAYQSLNASLDGALCQVVNPDGTKPFASYCNTPQALGEAVAAGAPVIPGPTTSTSPTTTPTTTPTTPTTPTTKPSTGAASTAASLLSQAQSQFTAASTALKDGNLGEYQTDVGLAQSDVTQAEKLLTTPAKS
jgi:hypothetical protein